MVRIKDIALKAKVSSATVSRILNEDESLSVAGETRQRVINIAEELGYQTVAKRRKARGQNSAQPLIGVLSCLSPDQERQDTYFLPFGKGLKRNALNRKFSLQIQFISAPFRNISFGNWMVSLSSAVFMMKRLSISAGGWSMPYLSIIHQIRKHTIRLESILNRLHARRLITFST